MARGDIPRARLGWRRDALAGAAEFALAAEQLARDTAAQVTPGASDEWAFFLPIDLPTLNVRLLAVLGLNHRAAKFNPLRTGMALPVINWLSRWLG